MFENLTNKLSNIFNKLRKTTILTEDNINEALDEIRTALLEADVAMDAVNLMLARIKAEAIGRQVVKSVSPEQMMVKIVHDSIVQVLSDGDQQPITINKKPTRIMLVGLQGSGKTTTAAKLAHALTKNTNYKALLTSVDVYRPAAIEQLSLLAGQVGASFTNADPSVDKPSDILQRAEEQVSLDRPDLFILDTAGRLHTDADLMREIKELKEKFKPHEVLLVIDSMTGQDSINICKEFHQAVGVTGAVLSRIDGDPRGGVALSIRAATGVPIRYLGVGEKFDQLELFNAKRIADRILDMGDIVSLVEKAQEAQDEDDERIALRMQKGYFDLNDFSAHFRKILKMGGFAKLLGFLPGLGGISASLKNHGFDDSFIKKNIAIISSMTKYERRHPEILKNARKLRIASGAGASVQEINRLLKQYEQMALIVKKMKNMPADKIQQMMKNMM